MPTGTADSADYRLMTHPIEIASGKESSAAVELELTQDQDVGEEDLTFDATVSGEAKNGPGTRSVMGRLVGDDRGRHGQAGLGEVAGGGRGCGLRGEERWGGRRHDVHRG